MIPAAVDYVRADSAEAAIAALVEHGDEAKLLAGGQSLVPLMRLRLATPTVLVDVGRATDLVGISVEGDTVSIGALTTHSTLEHSAELAAACPLLAHVASAEAEVAAANAMGETALMNYNAVPGAVFTLPEVADVGLTAAQAGEQGIEAGEAMVLFRILGKAPLPLEIRTRTFFNPRLESAVFLVPGLIVVILAMIAVMLTALTIAREYESGSLEQLFTTPSGASR